MIVVTHEMAFAREAADRVYFMDEGRWVEIGPPAQVLDAPREEATREFLARYLSAVHPRRRLEGADKPALDTTIHPHS